MDATTRNLEYELTRRELLIPRQRPGKIGIILFILGHMLIPPLMMADALYANPAFAADKEGLLRTFVQTWAGIHAIGFAAALIVAPPLDWLDKRFPGKQGKERVAFQVALVDAGLKVNEALIPWSDLRKITDYEDHIWFTKKFRYFFALRPKSPYWVIIPKGAFSNTEELRAFSDLAKTRLRTAEFQPLPGPR